MDVLIEAIEYALFFGALFGAVWAMDKINTAVKQRREFEKYVFRRNLINERRLRELSQRR